MLRANPEDTAGHPGRTGLSLNRSDFLAARGQQQASVSAASEPSDVGTAGLKAVGTEHSYKGGTGICLEIRLWETPRNRAGGGENPCLEHWVCVAILWSGSGVSPVGSITKEPSEAAGTLASVARPSGPGAKRVGVLSTAFPPAVGWGVTVIVFFVASSSGQHFHVRWCWGQERYLRCSTLDSGQHKEFCF